MFWVPLQQSLEHRDPLSGSPRAEVDFRERDVGALVLRRLFDELLQKLDRSVGLPTSDEHERKIVDRLAVVLATFEGFTEVFFGAVQVAAPAEQQTKVVESFRKIRLKCERLLV